MKIYALRCFSNKYYVGRSLNINKRIKSHFNNEGSGWTLKYPPVKIDMIVNGTIYDEDKYTLMYMDKYGINNVRGGTYCRLVLPNHQLKTINDQLNTIPGLCYICGGNHFVSQCNFK